MTPRDEARLGGVAPGLRVAIAAILEVMAQEHHPMFVVEGVRTTERQKALYAQGRTTPGPVVTACDGVLKRSHHQVRGDGLGYAVDCAFADVEPFADHHPWERYGALAKEQGLAWGGDWPVQDRPHVEAHG